MKTFLFPLLLLPFGNPCFAAVLFDLNDVALDGTAGENTYITRNSATTGGLTYNSGTPSLTYNLNAANSYSYFVSYFDAQTLSVGDAIELSYSFTPSSTSSFRDTAGAFRVGLYNSKTDQASEDSNDTGLSEYNDDRGYMGVYSPRGTSDTFFQRTGNNNLLWSSSTRTAVTGSPTLDTPGTDAVTGLLRLTLQTPTSLLLESQLNGSTVQSVLDTSGLETTFDALSFFAMSGSNTSNSLTFTEMTVTLIPEPSSLLLVTMAGLIFMIARKRSA
ncbi:PEP-CTERM sorting domain-containing protein [Kiritimatiellaeota bacterium B1221]|nr:PEP-CTERM sorting domain-containing protein [Kiritimatiellaeota bacterium B1221]